MSAPRTPRAADGFTLVELLVVVLILAILTSVALPLYNSTVQNAEFRAARANMQTIANAQQAYRLTSPTHSFATTLGVLPDAKDIRGPGTRTYSIVPAGTACVANPSDKRSITVPDGSFGVKTSTDTDGCYIPGISRE